jgi:hypothetical protein
MCFAHALRYFPSFRFLLLQSNLHITLYKSALSNKSYFPLPFPSNPRTITPFTQHSLYHNTVTPFSDSDTENTIHFQILTDLSAQETAVTVA